MSDRFNKSNLLAALERHAESLEKRHGFDRNSGTSQLKDPLATREVAVAYGDYRFTLNLIRGIEDGSFLRR